MADWLQELVAEVQANKQESKDLLEWRLHQKRAREERGEILFRNLKEQCERGVAGLPGITLGDAGKNAFRLTKIESPGFWVDASLGVDHLLFTTRLGTGAGSLPNETPWAVEFCLNDDNTLYLCFEGRRLAGIEDVLKKIFEPLM